MCIIYLLETQHGGTVEGEGEEEGEAEGAKKTSLYVVVVGKIPRESVLGVLGEMH